MSDICGILLADKPEGFTSFDLCAKLRRLTGQRRIGHAGTLDPMATGVMTILLGQATRAAELLPVQDKRYRAAFRFGLTSDTLDIWGKTIERGYTPIPRARLEAVLDGFRGEITQLPPMYSAVHADGKRLYELARQGIEVERQRRPARIMELRLLSFDEDAGAGELEVLCSKGTYIRTLIDDIGERLGCGGVMTGLRRLMAAGFPIEQALSLERITALCADGSIGEAIIPVDAAFTVCPRCTVSDAQAVRYINGGELDIERIKLTDGEGDCDDAPGLVRVYGQAGFIGLGKLDGAAAVLRPFKRFV